MTTGIRDRVAAEIVNAGRSKRSVAADSGVPLTTLDRKLRSDGNFTVRELAMISGALGVPFVRLLPDELREARAAA